MLPNLPDGALVDGTVQTFTNPPASYTSSYTLTIGIAKQTWNAAGPVFVAYELVASQDINIPLEEIIQELLQASLFRSISQ